MALKQTIEIYELLDSATVTGETVAAALQERGLGVQVIPVQGQKGSTDFLRAFIPGREGKRGGGQSPTLGIIGRLGGLAPGHRRLGWCRMPMGPSPRLPVRSSWQT